MNSATFADFGLGRRVLHATHKRLFAKILALPAYHWTLLASVSVAFAHVAGVSVWLLGLLCLSAFMQKPSIKRVINTISNNRLTVIYQSIQLTLVIGGSLVLWLAFGQSFGVEIAVGFLMLCFIGKLWELYQKRDAYVALNLALFVLASAFLLRQDLSVALVGLPSLLLILLAFVVMSDDANTDGAGRLQALAMLSIPAVPLLVLLFVFFPRIPPIWSLPMAKKTATTGMSDSLSFGDFSTLSQSTKLAFRVEFAAQKPMREQMYWRGLVFSDFDGATWRPSERLLQPWLEWIQEKAQPNSPNQSYQVILEPTQEQWLFALDYPVPTMQDSVILMNDLTVRHAYPVAEQLRYTLAYQVPYPDVALDVPNRQYLQLPAQGNHKSKQLAQQLLSQAKLNPVRYIQAVRHYIGTQGFVYTLSPPILRHNRVDEFLFESKAGFCEHYASSFTFLMRAAGIPARVVVGYQGGELGRDGRSWEVRQMDAHAWSEVWLAEQGWVRIDPTSFVSPERIENGMNALTQETGATMFGDGVAGQWSYRQFQLLQTLRRYSDQVSYYWQRDIVGFDQDKQKKSLFKWFKISTFAQQFWLLVGGFVLLLLTFALMVWRKRKKRHHALDLPLLKLSKRLAKSYPQLNKAPHESYLAWLDRVNEQLHQPASINELKTLYRQSRYGQDGWDKSTIRRITALVRQLEQG
ncbi:MAG: DUF3488 and transglutaminase-like domain-containing protein [Moraxella sp.]|nr:DUF3488 and transglutaminase-like domain-containing protein [Moraxella sp.]